MDREGSGWIRRDELKRVLLKNNFDCRSNIDYSKNQWDASILDNIRCDYIDFLWKMNVFEELSHQLHEEMSATYKLIVRIESASNIGDLFNGVPPNSFVQCVSLNFSTDCVSRDLNPRFDYVFETEITASALTDCSPLRFNLVHRGYNADLRDHMYKLI